MRSGRRTRTRGVGIDYQALRKTSPEAARRAVVEYFKRNGQNVSATARMFGINRCVVYDILGKWVEGDLRDRPKTPKHPPNKTPEEIEAQVIAAKNKTRLGPERLSRYLRRYEGVSVAAGTIRHILRRNRDRITSPLSRHRRRKEQRPFVALCTFGWYSAKPFEIVQMDPSSFAIARP